MKPQPISGHDEINDEVCKPRYKEIRKGLFLGRWKYFVCMG